MRAASGTEPVASDDPRENAQAPPDDTTLLALLPQLDVAGLIDIVDRLKTADGDPRAIALYRAWISVSPHKRDQLFAAWYNLGAQLSKAGETAAAAAAFRTATALKPDLAAAAVNAGLSHEELGDAEGALRIWSGALQGDEDRTTLLNHRGRLLESLKRNDEAERSLRASLLTIPDQPDALHHWVAVKTKSCSWPLLGALPGLDRAALERHLGGLSLLALSDDGALHHRANADWIARKFPPTQERLSLPGGYGHRRLRIGYLSSDFCQHPMAYLVADLFEQHDRGAVEVYGYCSTREDGSAVRRRVVAAFDRFTSVLDMTDEEAARAIRADEIDVLVDLNGLTLGTRLPVLRWRPAPVQVTYLGYNGPIPLPELDYIVADRFVIPPETAAGHRPAPLYLPRCYQSNDRFLPVAPVGTRAEAGLPDGAFVFCCFSNNWKITEEMFAAWTEILRRADGSVLWLYADNDAACRNLSDRFAASGLASDRLIFAARTSPETYRGRLALADLFLDTFPYNAGTTASDALRVGLPIVTLSGRSFVSRMAGSLLEAAGLGEGIVGTLTDYVDLALALATDGERYRALRAAAGGGKAWRSGLGDTPAFARDFEAALTRIAIGLTPTPSVAAGSSVPHSATVHPEPPCPARLASPSRDGTTALPRRILHVGCGRSTLANGPAFFQDGSWSEIRLDIDPDVHPDVIGTMTDMSAVETGSVDAVFSSHTIEHLFPHEVPVALAELRRVLKADGFVLLTCPDLQTVAALIAGDALLEPAYLSAMGPVSPIDILFGHRASIARGNHYMAHRGGFTAKTLTHALLAAGFPQVVTNRRPAHFDLWTLGFARDVTEDERVRTASSLLPS